MIGRRSSAGNLERRLPLAWLWLLLATIAAHATLPVGSPIARTSGSAFSATTLEVALAPKRKTGGSETALERDAGGRDANLGSAGDSPYLPAVAAAVAAPWPAETAYARALIPADPDARPALAFRARAPPAA